jgi:hypothetical protein
MIAGMDARIEGDLDRNGATGPRRFWRSSLALFLVAAIGFALWRAPGDLVWDDSPTVCANLYPPDGGPTYSLDDPHFLPAIWHEVFGHLQMDGYRPFNWSLRRVGAAAYVRFAWATEAFLALNAVLVGLLAVAFFRLARRYVRTDLAGYFAVFLLLASTPLLTGLLVLFTGIQTLVPLLACSALHCYFGIYEGRRPRGCLLGLALILFLGPWYREFVGLAAVLILFLELQNRRWLSGVSLLAGLGLLHALFPTALLHALFFPELPVQPVYSLGALGEQARAGINPTGTALSKVRDLFFSLKWRIFIDLASILPPTLLVLSALAWLTAVFKRQPAMPWRGTCFLGFFFLLTFLPFLKVFKEHVHLAYCLVPATILVAASVEALWRAADAWARRLTLSLLLLLPIADHALNPVIVRGATRDCYSAIHRLAAFCDREVPDGAMLLSNAHHADEVRFCCHGRFGLYFTALTSGNRSRFVETMDALVTVKRQAGDRGIYCLDVVRPMRRGQQGGDRLLWVVRRQVVDVQSFGEIDRVSYRYPVLDPLKLLIPVRCTTWPGSPDLEFDYYRGPALDGSFGMREVAVRYYFYRVIDGPDVAAK